MNKGLIETKAITVKRKERIDRERTLLGYSDESAFKNFVKFIIRVSAYIVGTTLTLAFLYILFNVYFKAVVHKILNIDF